MTNLDIIHLAVTDTRNRPVFKKGIKWVAVYSDLRKVFLVLSCERFGWFRNLLQAIDSEPRKIWGGCGEILALAFHCFRSVDAAPPSRFHRYSAWETA